MTSVTAPDQEKRACILPAIRPETETGQTLSERFAGLPSPALGYRVETGYPADYATLAHHHYRAGRPATFKRVLVIREPGPPLSARWHALNHDCPQAHAAYRPPIAVLVESLPSLSCRLRDAALDNRYACLRVTSRAALLNQEVRTISRVVVEPRYRGRGLAVCLVRHALATATTPITEAVAAMGKVNPFFERAGMTAYRRPPLPQDRRLLDALRFAGLHALDLVDAAGLAKRITRPDHRLNPSHAELLRRELRRYHRQACGRSRLRHSEDTLDHLLSARRRLLLQPVYYLARRPHTRDSSQPS